MKTKVRLDSLLVQKNLAPSREQAKRLIIAGQVMNQNIVLNKPGVMVAEDIELKMLSLQKYVSRGGLKLEGFMDKLDYKPQGKTCIDIGASTGGFTDYLLQNGANKILCVDVGHGILHWKLRQDERVEVMEKMNARYLLENAPEYDFDIGVIDVSFISLKLIIPQIKPLLKKNARLICLVKPQFEAGKEHIKKGGVVKSLEVQKKCLDNIIEFGIKEGLLFMKSEACCLKGPKGNQEYFVMWKKNHESNG